WNWDRNEAANIWWNYAHWFHGIDPTDPNDSFAYSAVTEIRASQHGAHQDTLPFHVLTLPPAKVPIPGAVVSYGTPEQIAMSLAISPNPSSVTTNVEFTVARSGLATLVLYDELGREVRRLISGAIPAGDHSISLALKDLQRGHYFLRLESEGSKLTRALIVE
ncbi:MAG: T9SS type A sorting domain-containing protein, partial [Candidatus Kapaibacterium sp.]